MGRAVLLAVFLAAAGPAAALTGEWRDLYDRCERAVLDDMPIDGTDLRQRPPPFLIEEVPDRVFGTRLELDVLRTSLNIVPTGIWLRPGGRFEMRLLEFPTRPGTRAICEIVPARGAPDLTSAEADAVLTAFRDRQAARPDGAFETTRSDADRVVARATAPNARGCPVVTSVTHDGAFFRATISEGAGVPSCGGLSLHEGRRRLQTDGADR
ncbi:MAG: hypothetical protein AAF390_04175 [Pseudomonadota bacterium]